MPGNSKLWGAYEKFFGILRSPRHLKPLMKRGESYVKDAGNFLEKLRAVKEIPKGAILVTAGVVGLYPGITHDGGLQILHKQYNKFKDKVDLTRDIIKMADFVLKNNLFEFDSTLYQHDYWDQICATVCLHFHGLY